MTNTHHPIATIAATSHGGITFSRSPVVRAMLSNNRMLNCQDVTQMVQACKVSGSTDRICRTANDYLNACFKKNQHA
eukprot:Nitzschia sp. Nitz4//scaffold82_size85912//84271//84501//NITZ4_005156-RA/size85912-processed-gene-0.44-mRNA-1//-1//CDS//3329558880//4873//frame0